jgi:hypothetical protein
MPLSCVLTGSSRIHTRSQCYLLLVPIVAVVVPLMLVLDALLTLSVLRITLCFN